MEEIWFTHRDLLGDIILFFGVGLAAYALSLKFPLKDYRRQQIQPSDYWMLAGAVVFALSYQYLLEPIVGQSVYLFEILARQAEEFFANRSEWLGLLAYIVLSDFIGYWAHRALHSKYIWDSHAFHHSAKQLTFISGLRGSPVHYLASMIPNSLVGYLVLIDIGFFAVMVKIFIEYASIHVSHSNVRIPGGRYLEYLLITPRLHFAHHHPNEIYTNTNYGFIFSIWDRMFGTYLDPDQIPVEEKGQLGLDYELDTLSLFTGINFSPRVYPSGKSEAPTKAA